MAADQGMVEQSAAACCYATSDKYWVTDPAGLAWEAFHTLGSIPLYGEDTDATKKPCRLLSWQSGKRKATDDCDAV